MTVALTTPITGLALATYLTSPTFTIVADTPPFPNGKQWLVTALGGTQTGVTAHSVSDPYTILVSKPASPKALPRINPQTGLLMTPPAKNVYTLGVRTGGLPAASQDPAFITVKIVIEVPAGVDSYDKNTVASAVSCLIGAFTQTPQNFMDLVLAGNL